MIRMIVLLAAVAMCAGCVGSALESKREEPEVFRLTMPETADAGAALPRALAVGRPRAPVSLDTERIAVAGPATRFDYYADVRWAEPAPLMLQHLLVQALAADGQVRDRGRGAEPGAERLPARDRAATLRGGERRTGSAGGKGRDAGDSAGRRRGTRLASFPATASVAAEADRRADVMSAFDAATRQVISSIVAATRSAAT